MARDDDDNDDSFYGSHNDYGGGSSASGKGRFDKTSNFSTMISKDGRFLGFKLDPEVAKGFNTLYPILLNIFTEKGADLVTKQYGFEAGRVAGYAIALSDQIIQTGQNLFHSAKSLNELRVAVQPLAKVGQDISSTSALSGNNEVIVNARAKINGVFLQRMIETVVTTVGAAPALYGHITKAKLKNHELERNLKIKNAKGDPEKLAKILQEEITVSGTKLEGVSPQDLRAATDKIIETSRAEYENKFKVFKSTNESTLKKDIEAILKDLKEHPQNISGHLSKLQRLGVNTESLKTDIDNAKRWNNKNSAKVESAINKIIEDFTGYKDPTRKGSRRSSTQYLDDALKAKFVKQEGAFDREWLDVLPREEREYLSRDSNVPPTKKEQIEQQVKNIKEGYKKSENDKSSSGKDQHQLKMVVDSTWGLVAGLARGMLTSFVGEKTLTQYEQPIALDRILHLRRVMENAGGEAPEQIPGIRAGKSKDERDEGYAKYINGIFQQNQDDSHRAEIGDRFVEHFEKVRWDDDAIQNLPDAELTPYEYALKTIAKRIKNGRMDAIALIELVGDTHGKRIVRADGRSFGPQGAGDDDESIKKAMLQLIDEKTAVLPAGQQQTEEQINDKLGNFVFSVADLKQALESKDFDPHQRAFIFTVFSDIVGSDAKLCQKIGVSNERCIELRKGTKESFNTMLDGAVSVLAEMIENEPDDLEKKLKLTDKEKKMILSLAGRLQEEGKNVADLAENKEEITALETLVVNATMTIGKEPAKTDEEGKSQGFWQRLVAATTQQKAKNEHGRDQEKDEDAVSSRHKADSEESYKSNTKKWALDESGDALDDDRDNEKWVDEKPTPSPKNKYRKIAAKERNESLQSHNGLAI